MNDEIKRSHRSLPLHEWPTPDQEGWRIANLPPHFARLSVGYARRWKASTRKLIEIDYGHFLSWLDATGKLDRSLAPADRITPEILECYLEAMRLAGFAPYTISGRIARLGNALRAIAPGNDWHWVCLAGSRLQCLAEPITDFEARFRPAPEILELALALIDAAETSLFRTATERAVLSRDGLLVGFFMLSVLRRGNVSSIFIGEQLQRRGGTWWLSIAADETKSGKKRIEFEFPETLRAALDRYMEVHRKVLLGRTRKALAPTNALWISKQGTQMTSGAIALQVKDRTREHFGTAINPQIFRQISATTTATENPGGATDIMLTHSHTTMATSEDYYNKAKMLDASRRHQLRVDALRQGSASSEC